MTDVTKLHRQASSLFYSMSKLIQRVDVLSKVLKNVQKHMLGLIPKFLNF